MIDPDHVVSVYSGRPGCMCGCRGKHTYARAFVAEGSKRRGYAVDQGEVSDRSVRTIVRKLNADPATKVEDGIAFLDLGHRCYAAYLREETRA